tara:strand:+ start:52 stop:279 length:228 start_codon:yes stop_codon:yes gene_type:complete
LNLSNNSLTAFSKYKKGNKLISNRPSLVLSSVTTTGNCSVDVGATLSCVVVIGFGFLRLAALGFFATVAVMISPS